ncbi:hypothetical protein ACPPVS_01330 [Cellulomonas sp. McL0617]|uniref:hypothetical protein n=1 Tax=Cellulomonas sp. McL0617 TaxID=3415675 RepID=UPI003CEDE5CF
MRIDDGVVSILVPNCPDEPVESAEVDRMAADVPSDPPWKASGFTGEASSGIVLGSADWTSVDGSYAGWTWFSATINTQGNTYGTAVQNAAQIAEMTSLPTGSFWVDGHVMTTKEYQARVRNSPARCRLSPRTEDDFATTLLEARALRCGACLADCRSPS